MKRIIVTISIALAAMLVTVPPAQADEAAPTAEQLEAAKKAFADGKQLHDQGKLPDAIDKFKESYRLSRNPLLLYNIAFTLDEAGQKDTALFYYRKFLSDAPQGAAQRKTVDDRVKVLEKEKLEADLNGPSKPDATKPDATKPDTTKPEEPAKPAKPVKIKPAGTYGPDAFQHQIVEEAPPSKPLDVTAFVPEDSGFTVTLFYRGAGDSTFTAKPMKWRYKELVARIPSGKIGGSSIQYYLEVKDQAGAVVTRSGKSTSPNLVNVEAGATARFYPDMTDDGDKVNPAITKHHDEEDPLGGKHDEDKTVDVQPDVPVTPGTGYRDVGSQKFKYAKWGSTATAGVLLGLGVTFYIMASKQADNLIADSTSCGSPPCRMFDTAYDAQVQDAGKRDQTISNVTLGVGVAAAAVAGYFWYRELTAKKHGELKVTTKNTSPETTWVVAPSLGEGFTGAAAAARF